MLPRTSDLIFVNVKTQEGSPYTLELTMKGWRIASSHTDCMNGDYTKVCTWFRNNRIMFSFQISLHTKYYRNARELLKFISPDHATRFNECVAQKLSKLAEVKPPLLTLQNLFCFRWRFNKDMNIKLTINNQFYSILHTFEFLANSFWYLSIK